MVDTQQWLDENYPKSERKQVKKLDLSRQNLTGSLDLSDFVNLEVLNCANNQLTSLDLSNSEHLQELDCFENSLTEIKFPLNGQKLKNLNLMNNNFPAQDLSMFKRLANLEELFISNVVQRSMWGMQIYQNTGVLASYPTENGYNRFHGSLKPLSSLSKLKHLDISNTNIDSGLEYLRLNDKEVNFNLGFAWSDIPNCGVKKIETQLLKANNMVATWDKDSITKWKNVNHELVSLAQQIYSLEKLLAGMRLVFRLNKKGNAILKDDAGKMKIKFKEEIKINANKIILILDIFLRENYNLSCSLEKQLKTLQTQCYQGQIEQPPK